MQTLLATVDTKFTNLKTNTTHGFCC